MSFLRHLFAVAVSVVLLVPGSACAHGGAVMNFYGQASASLLVRLPEAQTFGGIELHADASLVGIGLFAGLGWERADNDGDVRQGGYFLGGLELRPMTWGGRDVYQMIDFHLGTGGLIGGLGGEFMGALVFNLGVDIALSSETEHPMISIEYRVTSPQIPNEATTYLLAIGFGFRGA